LREGELADLALELGEVVGSSDALELLLHLAVYPRSQTTHMDQAAGALALAGRRPVLRYLKHSVCFIKVVRVPQGEGLSLVF
jgi:hypothetical protein